MAKKHTKKKRPFPAHLKRYWFKAKKAAHRAKRATSRAIRRGGTKRRASSSTSIVSARRSRGRSSSSATQGVSFMAKHKARRSGGSGRRASRRGGRGRRGGGGGGGFSLRGLVPSGATMLALGGAAGAYAAYKWWDKIPGDRWKSGEYAPLLGAAGVGLVGSLVTRGVAPAASKALFAGAIAAGVVSMFVSRGGGASRPATGGGSFTPASYTPPALPAPTGGGGGSTASRVTDLIGQVLARLPGGGGGGSGVAGYMDHIPTTRTVEY